jgi:hydroxyacylglutathione hydrolase
MSEKNWYETFTVGAVSTNCYLVSGTYLIDPGGMNESLKKALEQYGDQIQAILLTHAHYDHIAGIGRVRERIGDCPIICHEKDRSMLADPEKNMSLWSGETVSFEADRTVEDEEVLSLGEVDLDVVHTPGHTQGSVSYYLEADQLLFAGDTLFKDGIGRTDLPGGDHQQLLRSIKQEILTLPRGTTVLPGHGPETSVGEEAHDNPYLD